MTEISYQYKPRLKTGILALLFFGLCSFALYHKAQTNDVGLIINGIIELSQNGATIFYYSLFGGAITFVILGVLIIFNNLTSKREIKLTETCLVRPKNGFSSQTHSIPYSEIASIEEQLVYNQTFLKINHKSGKNSIPQSMFKNKETFKNFIDDLSKKLQLTQG